MIENSAKSLSQVSGMGILDRKRDCLTGVNLL